ncbi:MAG TPA: hypothetical protein PLZ93_01570 [Nocardioides sp.]|uniref:hypothetical protein n=1 Tax=uncultured Nocardioides sp. TaxID=198441 RepID=UPI000EBCFD10|nr:hypothetical protein [uncultured Nocardioides sp.]HCB05255.1 hypothetical protein [Nocardioides sp.]HRD63130.1 hypothetical protein [Nocardioides sp.]HRI94283.1 hypothetical protein [Nocardioides sp.]HRK47481.1 hypothetical protein [Nocardioides sp.]
MWPRPVALTLPALLAFGSVLTLGTVPAEAIKPVLEGQPVGPTRDHVVSGSCGDADDTGFGFYAVAGAAAGTVEVHGGVTSMVVLQSWDYRFEDNGETVADGTVQTKYVSNPGRQGYNGHFEVIETIPDQDGADQLTFVATADQDGSDPTTCTGTFTY